VSEFWALAVMGSALAAAGFVLVVELMLVTQPVSANIPAIQAERSQRLKTVGDRKIELDSLLWTH